MSKLNALEKQFEASGRLIGSVFVLRPSDALRFVDACERARVAILGVEGFRVFGDKIQPDQDHGFDLEGRTEGSHDYTRRFITERLDSDLWFEVVADLPRSDI